MDTKLEVRIDRLEAESAVRKLKARYLNACDAKNIERIRGCFTPDAQLVYPPIGEFGVDGLIEVFSQVAATTPIVDVHQVHNAEIEIEGDEASALWNLGFSTYDPREGTFRLLASFYHDRYVRTSEGWRISYSRSEPRAVIDGKIAQSGVAAAWVAE